MAVRRRMKKVEGRAPLKMHPRVPLEPYIDKKVMEDTARKISNWNRWGPDDEIGTLNFVTPEDIAKATALVKKGKSFSLALPFDQNGPQNSGGWGMRFNPIHTMLATGTDAVSGRQGVNGGGYADDMVTMPLQCGTQWDGLAHAPSFLRAICSNSLHSE